jgi:hypothetical protein
MCKFLNFAFRNCTTHPVHLSSFDLFVLIVLFENYEMLPYVVVSNFLLLSLPYTQLFFPAVYSQIPSICILLKG